MSTDPEDEPTREDRLTTSTTRFNRFLSFWATFPGVLTGGVFLLVGITVVIAVLSYM